MSISQFIRVAVGFAIESGRFFGVFFFCCWSAISPTGFCYNNHIRLYAGPLIKYIVSPFLIGGGGLAENVFSLEKSLNSIQDRIKFKSNRGLWADRRGGCILRRVDLRE
jgi:hypothetical protein